MDIWKYFDITHREHVLCNPTSKAKLDEMIGLLRLEPDSRVLDIATGKGEFILRMAEKYGVGGVGVDISPYCIEDARTKLKDRAPQAPIEFLEMDASKYQPKTPHSFGLAACIGASWIYDGHEGTLKALQRMVEPGGWIVVGEPFWKQQPPPAYLESLDIEANAYGTHFENVQTGEELGLSMMMSFVSSHDDWDRYEGLQWYAAENYARQHPDDPDVPELMRRVHKSKEEYLRWGRDVFGWALYIFRTAA